MTDIEFNRCIKQIVHGNSDGLRSIYNEYSKFIYQTVYPFVNRREDAEDITADFFVHLYKIASSYHSGNGHRGWLATIARNQAIDYLRKHSREICSEELAEENADSGEFSDNQGTFAQSVEDEVISSISLRDALDQLSLAEREIVAMKIIGELTFREIADVLGKPMGTVTWAYQNALKKLRRLGYE